jgi:hypothetical protein
MRARNILWVLIGCVLVNLVSSPQALAYEYAGQAWCCDTVYYKVNPTNPSSACGSAVGGQWFRALVNQAAATWNALGTQFQLVETGTTSTACQSMGSYCQGIKDGQNTVAMASGCSWGDPSIIAYSTWWYWTGGDTAGCIYESDICFNNNVMWYNNNPPCSGNCYDLKSVATHELGHWIAANHENHDAILGYKPVMYYAFNYCEMRRNITADDNALVNWAYDPLGVIALPNRTAVVHYHPPYPNPPAHDTCCFTSKELVNNGNMEGGFYADPDDNVPNGWKKYETFSGGVETSLIGPFSDNGPTLPGSISLYWTRVDNGSQTGDWTAVDQYLGYDISRCQCATLNIDIKVLYHSLGGSGWTVSDYEYPVTVVIYYIDAAGTSRYWQWGWWQWIDGSTGPNPDHEAVPGNGVVTGQQVAYNVWVPNTFDLLTELTNPKIIKSIRVGGAGWSYEGRADNIQLLVCDSAFPRDLVVCEPQGGGNPTHPNTYWYDVTPGGGFGRCDFHVKVHDTAAGDYSAWVEPPTWQHSVHKVGNDWWASWWDPDCSNAVFTTFRFQFNNAKPSSWGDWRTTISATSDPFTDVIDSSGNHSTESNGYGYRVHVPGCCNSDGRRGDVDMSGTINVADVTYLTAYLKGLGGAPPCYEEGDVDGSCTINVADVTYLVAYIKNIGPAPPACP